MDKDTAFSVEIFILLAIVVLNVLDFLELLDPFWDYVKKIISWTLVGYLFWHISPTQHLFGERHKWLDLSVIVACFSMILNDLLQYFVIMRGIMVAKAYEYLVFDAAPVGAVADHVVTVTSEGVWNSLNLAGFVPNAMKHLSSVAPLIDMGREHAVVAFTYLGKQISYAAYPQGVNGALLQFYNSVVPFANVIQEYALYAGLVALLLVALFVTLRVRVKQKSFVGLISFGDARGLGIPLRFIIVFLALLCFSLFIFNLVMEWLAIAIDAPILMLAIAVSLLLLITHHVRFSLGNWVEWVTSFGVDFLEPFANLFMRKSTVLLGVSSLLVLHVLTEIGNFLLPFVMPMRDSLYLSQLGPGHENLFSLIVFSASFLADVSSVLLTVLVVIAWLLLLGLPGYIWYKIFRLRHEDHERHHPRFAPWLLGLFCSSLVVAWLVPLITFHRLEQTGLVGVDFLTHSIADSGALVSAPQALLIALLVFVVVFVLGQFSIRRFLYLIPLLASVAFMGVYVYNFFFSSFAYYLLQGMGAFVAGSPFLGIIMFLFLFLTIIFYVSGYISFLYEIVRD